MKNFIDKINGEDLNQHETVEKLVELCGQASRQWINDEVSRDYVAKLSGWAGLCLEVANQNGLEGHYSDDPAMQREAHMLLAKLNETSELLGYAIYAAAELSSMSEFTDSPELRRMLVDKQVDEEPGISFPEP
ncbi:hypothetical protein [Rhodopirellula bahusiensis]|uniref:hypothetical protein n=2 Tax=Rhodopirellula bahusiensis TaxID=2014065 RepID=UPI003265327B